MKSKANRAKQSWGFSLLEVMVASLIITSASIALFPLQVSLLNSADDALTRQYALFALENQLEKFMSYSKSEGDKEAGFALLQAGSRSVGKAIDIRWQVTPIRVNSQGDAGLKSEKNKQSEIAGKRVVISAKWHDKRRKVQTIQLQTVIAK
ncbi:hypothetical protein MACH09_06310 [Vibrio sp. MACH09]|uniref:type IV pilus modification PilV family protein n=1 Tax=Vibrio sp. MACH09 TaxID=3025122 RepID=UPI00279036A7|nr:hypothetical protein [Vibrio sp. MACH09]GLO60123.1 hypothetical protein MACH09_06310 [Vibrio sp. MACH09]